MLKTPDGRRIPDVAAWTASPEPHPDPNWPARFNGFAGENAVAERRVYRVTIPPAEEARETARPKKLEGVR
jgi:hypothetical protein